MKTGDRTAKVAAMGVETQLNLLGEGKPDWVENLRTRVRYWAEHGVFLGGSSWKYDGWLGQIYTRDRYLTRGKFSMPQFERNCLSEYADFFPTVCGDFSFYDFYSEKFWAGLFAQVPSSFQFGFKVPERITCPVFPQHPRYGAVAGQRNNDFLNAELVTTDFIERLRPYRSQIGYLVFEFPQFHKGTLDADVDFLDRLDPFLAALPKGMPYGVEIRTKKLLGPDYFSVLRKHGVTHAFNSWTRMPSVGEQLDIEGSITADFVVTRLLLRPGRTYEQAVKAFSPYAEVKDPCPEIYRDTARLVKTAQQAGVKRGIYLATNNRLVGNAPGAIARIVAELDNHR